AARPLANEVSLQWPEDAAEIPLHTDRAKLKVTLRNLVDNAVKFTPRGTVSIAARYDAARAQLCVSVCDTGVGIPAGAQASIFEMVQQLDTPRHVAQGGVGLALYLVRRYVELIGGRVVVESTPGQGSTFTIEIPTQL